jgi:hypothetical protein
VVEVVNFILPSDVVPSGISRLTKVTEEFPGPSLTRLANIFAIPPELLQAVNIQNSQSPKRAFEPVFLLICRTSY